MRLTAEDMTQSKRVLELGSGVGFLGIIVAALQIQCSAAVDEVDAPGFLYLTDINDDVLSRCQDNLRLASSGCDVARSITPS